MSTTPETFDEAVARFQQFLRQNGRPNKVVWLKPRDIVLSGTRVAYVKMPPSQDNEREARKLYEYGLSQGRGILFHGMFETEGATCSRVWVPADDREAECALLPPLVKLSVSAGEWRMVGESVHSRLRWLYLRLRHSGKQQFKKDLL